MTKEITDDVNSLRELAMIRGYNMDELAEAMDVSRQTVSNWNCGRHLPTSERLHQLASDDVLASRPSKIYSLIKARYEQQHAADSDEE